MEFLVDLWLPILVATVALWMSSFVAWVVLPHHFEDFKELHCEQDLMNFLDERNVAAGSYFFPRPATAAGMNSKEHMQKYEKGPRGIMYVYEMPNMGLNMLKTVLYFLVVVTTIAYITHVACPPNLMSTNFTKVFRFAGTIGILVFASSGVLNKIWFTRRMWTDIVDGVVYGLVLGMVFGVLWKYPGG